ncbi:hypothetical protein FY534_01435 [Alicyclobacillus sp. TC]|uniref:hypothetical protein n=1 Tax=Alicyclobacillus sp. TC TaxID=2606450 RepID=UPI0013F4C771|nr:hypothetical protein [Alicyclobacillus sp. TC]QRF22489.1 hypothetical protein FY534_01435 [Alicyclobacillus sp. TC]
MRQKRARRWILSVESALVFLWRWTDKVHRPIDVSGAPYGGVRVGGWKPVSTTSSGKGGGRVAEEDC